MTFMKLEGRAYSKETRSIVVDGKGRYFPQMVILPGYFDGRERPGEGRGSRFVRGNKVSHDCGILRCPLPGSGGRENGLGPEEEA